jgi:hypothetical protein
VKQPTPSVANCEELERLYEQALVLLDGLDELGLYQAGAHLSLAIEAIRRRHPALASLDHNDPA